VRVAGVEVRVKPSFFFVAVLFGASRQTAVGIATWVLATFVSVLFHEAGHAVAGRAFGLTPSIELYERGGLTRFARGDAPLRGWKDIVITLAGPGAGFVLGGAVLAVATWVKPEWQRETFVRDMLYCNLGWSVVNLLPILPLDGGQVARTLLGDERRARVLSVLTAGAAGAFALYAGWAWGALYAVWFGAPNVTALRRMHLEKRLRELVTTIAKDEPGHAGARAEYLARGVADDTLRGQLVSMLEHVAAKRRGQARRVFEAFAPSCDPEELEVLSQTLFYADEFDLAGLVSRHIFERTRSPDAAYNTACALARLGQVEEGVRWLAEAESAGYRDVEHLVGDEDLAALREHPRFAEVTERLRATE
jgi:Zn-dependent protease